MVDVSRQILHELKAVKERVSQLDVSFQKLREEFGESHMTGEERKMVAEALEEERLGKTVSLAAVKKRLGV